jgi:hypothetical protein
MRDFGYSSGQYAQERDAFRRFQQLAESRMMSAKETASIRHLLAGTQPALINTRAAASVEAGAVAPFGRFTRLLHI